MENLSSLGFSSTDPNASRDLPAGKSMTAAVGWYLYAIGEYVKPVLNYTINPYETIAERERSLGSQFEQLQAGLSAVQAVFKKYVFENPVQQLVFFEYLAESREGDNHFYDDYRGLNLSQGTVTLTQTVFNEAFEKSRQAFLQFLEQQKTKEEPSHSIFNDIEKQIQALQSEKESRMSTSIDAVRSWLRHPSSISTVDATEQWKTKINEMKAEWNDLIAEMKTRFTKPFEIFDSFGQEIKVLNINFRVKCLASFDYKDKKKGIRFSVEFSNKHELRKYDASFFLKKNVTHKAIEIISIENTCHVVEAFQCIDSMIHHLMAEILLKERDHDFCLVRIIQPSNGNHFELIDWSIYGFESIIQEGPSPLPYDWKLERLSAESYLAGKQRYLEGCQIDLL